MYLHIINSCSLEEELETFSKLWNRDDQPFWLQRPYAKKLLCGWSDRTRTMQCGEPQQQPIRRRCAPGSSGRAGAGQGCTKAYRLAYSCQPWQLVLAHVPCTNSDRRTAPVLVLTPGWPTPGMGVCWLPAVHVTGWLQLLLVLWNGTAAVFHWLSLEDSKASVLYWSISYLDDSKPLEYNCF